MPHQQRALQDQGEPLDDPAGPQLDVVVVGQLGLHAAYGGVEPGVGAGRGGDLGLERRHDLGFPGEGAQHVQRGDVAGALPDRVQRGLAEEPRHARLLDVAVAAQAFEGLGRVRRPALADPVLADGEGEPLERGLAGVAARGPVGGPGEAHHQDGGGLGLDREVGEHVAHQGRLDEVPAEGLPVGGVVGGRGHALAHAGRRADDAVEAGQVDHVDDGAHATALVADPPGDRVLVLDLCGGVGAVAELVLEAHQPHRVARAVGQDARHEEAGEPARRPGEGEEDVAHRRRREPLVPEQAVGAVRLGVGGGGVGAYVRAALLLRHRHAGQQSPLGQRRAQPEVVRRGGEQRLVARGQLRGVPQRRHGGVGHRDRAAVAGVGTPGVELGRAGHVRARPVVRPRRGVQAVRDRGTHQLVPGRVELHLVDAVAVPVVGAQDRRVLVRQPPVLDRLLATAEAAQLVQLGGGPAGALAFEPVEQRRVVGRVVTDQRWNLVEDLVRRHGDTPSARWRKAVRCSMVRGPATPAARGPTIASARAPTSAVAVSSGSCGEVRRSPPLGDVTGDQLGVRAAEDEPLGVDRRVGRLGEQRVRQPWRPQRPAGERLDDGGDPLGDGALQRRRARHRVHLALRGGAEHLGDQVGLGREVPVDAAGRHPGPLGDGGDRAAGVPVLGHDLQRGDDDPLPGRAEPGLHAFGAPVDHARIEPPFNPCRQGACQAGVRPARDAV